MPRNRNRTVGPPWEGETVQVPGRINGWRVVAGAKLPGRPGAEHRFAVVCETNPAGAFVIHPDLVWTTDGYRGIGPATLLAWDEAMYLFLAITKAAVEGSSRTGDRA